MSRVYSVMTGTSAVRPVAEEPREDEPFIVEVEDAPFIEIGGPAGAVFSPAASAPPKPTAEVKLKTESARSYPRIASPAASPIAAPALTPAPAPAPVALDPTPATILSVRFHDVLPRAQGRLSDAPDPGLVALHFPEHPVSGEYRALRDEVSHQLTNATSRAITFTAATTEAGTTTVLLNLGITLARDGQRVLVIDANVNRPGVAAKLAIPASPGLAEVLSGQMPLPWAIQPTSVPSLQVLTAGSATDAASAASLGAAVGNDLPKLVGQLRQWFDWVLIDAGVWGVVPERDATCSAADAVYLVTREADAERPEFTGLRTWVKQLGGALRGYVTTRA
jgi:Mrp family chromosome partitioning ATPase